MQSSYTTWMIKFCDFCMTLLWPNHENPWIDAFRWEQISAWKYAFYKHSEGCNIYSISWLFHGFYHLSQNSVTFRGLESENMVHNFSMTSPNSGNLVIKRQNFYLDKFNITSTIDPRWKQTYLQHLSWKVKFNFIFF